jgi:hypothetical protein
VTSTTGGGIKGLIAGALVVSSSGGVTSGISWNDDLGLGRRYDRGVYGVYGGGMTEPPSVDSGQIMVSMSNVSCCLT